MTIQLSRRGILRASASAGALTAMPRLVIGNARAADTELNVFGPLPPDPAPPGAAKFSEDAFADWKAAQDAHRRTTSCSPGRSFTTAWPPPSPPARRRGTSATIAAGCRSSQATSSPTRTTFPKELVDDLPPSSFSTVTVDGKRYGAIFTLSLLTLFYNKEHLDQAGITAPPKDWDELKRCRQGAHPRRPATAGCSNYGDPAGIGGTASQWMVFLQQAGGKVYDENGQPAFNNATPASTRCR